MIRRALGRRGASLLFFAFVDFIFATALYNPPRPLSPTYTWPQQLMPLPVWAAVWAAVGTACVMFAFARRDLPGFIAAITIKIGWAVLLFTGWALGEVPRGYVIGGFFAAFAGFVVVIAGWPERSRPEAGDSERGRMWTPPS